MVWTFLNRFKFSFVFLFVGFFLGAYVSYKYENKKNIIYNQQVEIDKLKTENGNLLRSNNSLQFSIKTNNDSIIKLESSNAILEQQNEIVQKQYDDTKISLNKHVKLTSQLLFILQNSEQSNGVSKLPNSSARIKAESSATQLVNSDRVINAIKADLLQCNKYIIQLNTLIDNVNTYLGISK